MISSHFRRSYMGVREVQQRSMRKQLVGVNGSAIRASIDRWHPVMFAPTSTCHIGRPLTVSFCTTSAVSTRQTNGTCTYLQLPDDCRSDFMTCVVYGNIRALQSWRAYRSRSSWYVMSAAVVARWIKRLSAGQVTTWRNHDGSLKFVNQRWPQVKRGATVAKWLECLSVGKWSRVRITMEAVQF